MPKIELSARIWRMVTRVVLPLGRKGRSRAALRLAKAYLQRKPLDDLAWVLSSRLHHELGNPAASRAALKEGLDRNPQSSELAYRLAALELASAETGEARHILQPLLESETGSPRIYAALAAVCRAEGDLEGQKKALLEAESKLDATDFSDDVVQVAVEYLGQPGGLKRTRELLQPHADVSDPMPSLILGVIAEQEDPKGSAKMLRKARKLWGGQVSEFEEAVEAVRTALESADGPSGSSVSEY